MELKLTPKQKKFAEYYATSGNATDSALKAGYSKKTASEIGAENLKKPKISNYIKELTKNSDSERIADMQEIKELWSNIARGKIEGARIRDVLKATELLAKTNGAFLDKVELKGEIKTNNPLEELTKEELKELIKK